MNEQLESALSELITKATTGIDSASEFVISEAPDVIQQLNDEWLRGTEDRDPHFIPVYVARVFSVFSFVFVSINLTWLKIWIAPKVWLVEYAANLVK